MPMGRSPTGRHSHGVRRTMQDITRLLAASHNTTPLTSRWAIAKVATPCRYLFLASSTFKKATPAEMAAALSSPYPSIWISRYNALTLA